MSYFTSTYRMALRTLGYILLFAVALTIAFGPTALVALIAVVYPPWGLLALLAIPLTVRWYFDFLSDDNRVGQYMSRWIP